MRIVAGRLRGRPLTAPEGRSLRPTSDKLRESLFNILLHGDYPPLAGARIADVFAGTGALGLEALSRGAAEAVFIDQAGPALRLLRRNIDELGLGERSRVLRADATRLPRADLPVDIAFLDPPYGKGLAVPALAALAEQGWLAPGGLAVVETGRDEVLDLPVGYCLAADRMAGGSRLRFLERGTDASQAEKP